MRGSKIAAIINLFKCMSGLHPHRDSAESSLPRLVIVKRSQKLILCKIRPEGLCKREFRVGALPEQEITHTPFAARSYYKVGGRDARGVKEGFKKFFCNIIGVYLCRNNFFYCSYNLVSSAIAQCRHQRHAGVCCCSPLCLGNKLLHIFRQPPYL